MPEAASPPNARVEERLRTAPIVWLATTRKDGRPHLAPEWFFWDGESVLLFALPDSRRVRNLQRSPQVTLALDTADNGADVVMLEGEARLLDEETSAVLPPGFGEKYGPALGEAGTGFYAGRYTQPIVVTPTKFIAWNLADAPA
jgi:PPOX class probable F420-dependent enzyme